MAKHFLTDAILFEIAACLEAISAGRLTLSPTEEIEWILARLLEELRTGLSSHPAFWATIAWVEDPAVRARINKSPIASPHKGQTERIQMVVGAVSCILLQFERTTDAGPWT
jgi:hypothetical protein